MGPLKFMLTALAGLAIVTTLSRSLSTAERRLAQASLLAHLLSSVAQELIYRFVYGGGDMMMYQYFGARISHAIGRQNSLVAEAFKLLLQQDHMLPLHVVGDGHSTGSMSALAGILSHYWSDQLYVMGAVIGVSSTVGGILTYLAIRDEIHVSLRTRCQAFLLLLPTVVFWGSALLKESVIMGPVGGLTYALYLASRRRLLAGVALGAPSSLVIGLYKPYVLAGFFAASAVYVVSRRRQGPELPRRVSAGRLVALSLISVLFVIAFGQLYEEYSISEIGEQLAREQDATLRASGGSTYTLVEPGTSSLGGQLLYAPAALATVLFRPLLVESHNLLALLNAVEATAVLLLAISALKRRSLRENVLFVVENPSLAFFLTYALVLGLGIGLATTNLGTLSRYRIPMYGHFALVCAMLSARGPKPEGGGSPAHGVPLTGLP